jgi:PKD repeat protein
MSTRLLSLFAVLLCTVQTLFSQNLTLTGAVTNDFITSGCTGFITLTTTGGTPPYSYSWNTGEVNPGLSDLCPGIYCVTVTDAIGSSAFQCFQVVNRLVTDADCGICNGLIQLFTPPQNPTTTFIWSLPDGSTLTGGPNLFNACAGFYSITILSINGQTDTASVFVNQNFNTAPLDIRSNAFVCQFDSNTVEPQCEKVCPNSTVTYFVEQSQPGSTQQFFNWSVNGASSFEVGQYPNNNTVTVNWGGPGTGFISIFSDGACASEDQICVTIIESPQAQIGSLPAAVAGTVTACKGQTVYFDNQSLYADYYEWDFGDGSPLSSLENPEHTYPNPGTYTVRLVARSACLCYDTTFLDVEILDAAALSVDCAGTVCAGSTVTYTVSGNCPSVQWNISPNGTIVSGGGTSDASVTVQWQSGAAGTVTVLPIACAAFSCPEPDITRIPILNDGAEIEGEDRVCPGVTEVYSIEPFGGTNFVWTVIGDGTIRDGQGTNRISVDWGSFPSPTTNWVTCQYDNCYLDCGGRDSLGVRILSNYRLSGPLEVCDGALGNFNAQLNYNGAPLACNWTLNAPNGTPAWTSAAPTANPAIGIGPGVGSYRIIATPADPTLTCDDRAEWAVTTKAVPPALTGIGGPMEICPSATMTYEAQGGAPQNNIAWTYRNGPGAAVNATGSPLNITWGNLPPYQISAWQVTPDALSCRGDTTTINPNPVGPFAINGQTNLCENSIGTYLAPAFPNLDIQWSIVPASAGSIKTGQGSSTLEVFWNQPGGHVIQAVVCGQTATFPVTVWANPQPVIAAPAGVCPGEFGAVQTTTPFSTFEWRNASGAIIANTALAQLQAGSYTLKVTDGTGCGGTEEFSIDEYPTPILTISTTQPTGFCNNSENILIRAVTTPDADYTYTWQKDGLPFAGNVNAITSNQYGSYTCEATNQFGCKALAGPLTIIEICLPGPGVCAGNCQGGGRPPCPPGSVDIIVTPTAKCDSVGLEAIGSFTPGSAVWYLGLSGGPLTALLNGDNVTYTFPEASQYMAVVNVEVSGNICAHYDSVFVWAKAKFDAEPTCPGAPLQFEDVSGHLPQSSITNWAWNFDDPASGANNTSTLREPQHTFANAGMYQVALTVTSSVGCTSTVVKSVEISPRPAPVFAPTNNTCPGNATELAIDPDPNITNVSWNFGDPSSGTANMAEGGTVYHNFASPGNYNVVVTATNIYGCTRAIADQVTITPNPISGNITPANPAPLCEGSTQALIAPATNVVGYLWSTGATTPFITVGTEGIYEVTLTSANGCTYVPPPVNIEVRPRPDGNLSALITNDLNQIIGINSSSLTICQGEDVWLQASGNGTYNYTWSGGFGIGINQIFSNDRNNALAVGNYTYTVTITDPTTGCTNVSAPFPVVVNPNPQPFFISNAGGFCAGSNITLTYTGPLIGAGAQYIWSTGASTQSINTNESGAYSLVVSNQFGCTSSSTTSVYPGPNVQAVPSGCHNRCNPDTLCLPQVQGITSWQWLLNGNPIAGATSPNFVATQSGVYTAQLTDWFGCTATSGPLELSLFAGVGTAQAQVWSDVNNNGVIDVADTLLSGIQVNLMLGAAQQASTASVNGVAQFTSVPSSTNYTVNINTATLPSQWGVVIGSAPTNLSGCDDVETGGLLLRNTCSSVNSLMLRTCPGTTLAYNNTNLAIGQTQQFTFTNILGCDSTVTVTVAAWPTATTTVNGVACAGESFNYQGNQIPAGTSQSFTFQTSNGCDSTVIVLVAALQPSPPKALPVKVCPGDTYTYAGTTLAIGASQAFTLVNSVGCDSVVTVTVSAGQVYDIQRTERVCPGEAFTFNGTTIPIGQTRVFNYITYLGCDSIITIQVQSHPAATFDLQATTSCPNTATGSIEVLNLAGGTGPFEAQIGPNGTWQTGLEFEDLDGGNYTIRIRDDNDCIFEDDVEIPAYAPLSVVLPNAILPCESATSIELIPAITGDQTGLEYSWSTGATTPAIVVTDAASINLSVKNQCETIRASSNVVWADAGMWEQVYVPNAFAPDALEAMNKEFRVFFPSGIEVDNFHLEVFDRWGNKLHETDDYTRAWYGPHRDQMMQGAVFVWWLKADVSFCGRKTQLFRKGDVVIVR